MNIPMQSTLKYRAVVAIAALALSAGLSAAAFAGDDRSKVDE